MGGRDAFDVLRRAVLHRPVCMVLLGVFGLATGGLAYDGPNPTTYDQTLNGIRVVMTAQGTVIPNGLASFDVTAYVPITSANVGQDVVVQVRKYSAAGSSQDLVLVECTFTAEAWGVGTTVAFVCPEFTYVPYSASEGPSVAFFPYVIRRTASGSTTHNGRTYRVNATVVTEDDKEQNDTFETAADLGVVTSISLADLVLSDWDFYTFTTPSDPTLGSARVAIEYWELAGYADGTVLDQAGHVVGLLDEVVDGRRLTIPITPNTTYYVRLQNTFSDIFFYDLHVTLGPPDTVSIVSGPTGTPNPVASGGAVRLEVRATDSRGHALSYFWTSVCTDMASGGFSNRASASPTWTAPMNATGLERTCTIEVTVKDTEGVSASGSYTQAVAPAPHAVTIPLPPSGSPNPVASGGVVTLTVTAVDTSNHVLSYEWRATCPTLPSNGAFTPTPNERFPRWTAPVNLTSAVQTCTMSVTATDPGGVSATRTYLQRVNVEPHELTVATPAAGTPNPVASGGSVRLSAGFHDTYPHSLTYAWQATCDGLPSSGTFQP